MALWLHPEKDKKDPLSLSNGHRDTGVFGICSEHSVDGDLNGSLPKLGAWETQRVSILIMLGFCLKQENGNSVEVHYFQELGALKSRRPRRERCWWSGDMEGRVLLCAHTTHVHALTG